MPAFAGDVQKLRRACVVNQNRALPPVNTYMKADGRKLNDANSTTNAPSAAKIMICAT